MKFPIPPDKMSIGSKSIILYVCVCVCVCSSRLLLCSTDFFCVYSPAASTIKRIKFTPIRAHEKRHMQAPWTHTNTQITANESQQYNPAASSQHRVHIRLLYLTATHTHTHCPTSTSSLFTVSCCIASSVSPSVPPLESTLNRTRSTAEHKSAGSGGQSTDFYELKMR